MNTRLYRIQVAMAFAVVYIVWGSTYLAIRVGVRDIPPGLLAGVRFIVAGLIIMMLAGALGQHATVRRSEWGLIGLMAVALIFVGNGFVTWAEQWVASNQAALLIASGAFWTAWFGTFGRRGLALGARAKVGLVTGFIGVALMLLPEGELDLQHLWAQLAILVAPIAWSAGSMYSRSRAPRTPALMMAAWQMLVGGVLLSAAGLAAGEAARISWSVAGVGAFAYLTVFGSCLAYATYIWLINNTTPARLATIAYVNPAIATVLGWWLLDEVLSGMQFLGMLVIIASVFVVSDAPARRSTPAG